MKNQIFFLLVLLLTLPVQGQQIKTIKKDLQKSIEQKEKELTTLSDAIWEAAETSLEEYTSSKL